MNDTLAVLGCGITLAVALTQREALYYSPYPRLTLPPFDPLVGLALLGLLMPAIVTVVQEEQHLTPEDTKGDKTVGTGA